jgi:RNA polymerase sigma factor (sigma-70 family)
VLVDAYERHHQALYRYCRSIVHHEQDAQDALQSTLARAFAALPEEPHAVELRPWLYRIAHNEAVSILRRRRATVELDESLGQAGAMEDGVDARETLRVLQRDIAELPERQRAALILRELNGLGHAEIARVLDTTPTAVKQAIFDARRTLSHCRDGRELACREVQRVMSDGDGRRLRSRGVRAHLRTCAACSGFQADLARRPAELAALAPPLAPGAAAAIFAALQGTAGTTGGAWLTGTAGGLSAKAAIGLTLAAGVTAVGAVHHQPQPTNRPAATAQGGAARPPERLGAGGASDPISLSLRHTAAAIHEPTKTAEPTPARALAGPKTTAAAPGHAKNDGGPPGQTKNGTPPGQAKNGMPPGQADNATPPGQANNATPPGQANNGTPPGQADKGTPPGQAKNGTPPGQADKGTPPGQAKNGTPPGQAKKDAGAPGQAEKNATAPGQAKKNAAPPGQTPDASPPGQAEQFAGGSGAASATEGTSVSPASGVAGTEAPAAEPAASGPAAADAPAPDSKPAPSGHAK